MRRLSALALVAACLAPGATAYAHKGNPHFRSTILHVSPTLPSGASLQILNLDDRLALVNRSKATIVVLGYEDDPYVRLLPDGTVQVNRNSTAAYINNDRQGSGKVPPNAHRGARPNWSTVDKSSRYEWHDHRIHYMGTGTPPQVADPGKRTHVFDWAVPLRVGGRPGRITGSLTWVPLPGGGPPLAAIVALAVLVAGAAVLVAVVRRRRADDGSRPRPTSEPGEAW